jgi:hypothetical protein
VADRSSKAAIHPVRDERHAARRTTGVVGQGTSGMTFLCGVASAGWSNGGAGRCLTATLFKEARRG